MKTLSLLTLLLFSEIAIACNDQHFGLALNQRSYYNPASLCPYCKGSTFMSTGYSFMPKNKNTFGVYYAFGNDEENLLHGPWDFSYNVQKTLTTQSKAFSMRYAFAVDLGNWKAAIGARGSYYSIMESFDVPGATSSSVSTKLFDADAGVMLTNQKGLYVGVSMLHLGSPEKTKRNEFGIEHSISTTQTLNVMGGYVQKINGSWDLMPDVSLLNNKNESVLQTGAMIRFMHHFAAGGGVTVASDDKPTMELRGGYTSSKFKWLVSACPSERGWTIETGIVWRFWFTQDCNGGTCTEKPKPWKKLDDFIPHR